MKARQAAFPFHAKEGLAWHMPLRFFVKIFQSMQCNINLSKHIHSWSHGAWPASLCQSDIVSRMHRDSLSYQSESSTPRSCQAALIASRDASDEETTIGHSADKRPQRLAISLSQENE